jgi:tripartite-type tricarboxylate transporter receptor subunit TctC
MARFSVTEAKAGGKYPNKPINVVVPWDAGGGSDVFVRTLVTDAKKYLGQPMTVLNRGGAGEEVVHYSVDVPAVDPVWARLR